MRQRHIIHRNQVSIGLCVDVDVSSKSVPDAHVALRRRAGWRSMKRQPALWERLEVNPERDLSGTVACVLGGLRRTQLSKGLIRV